MSRRHILFGLVLLVGLPLLAGCGALFGQRYDNFRAYYNTFYNAQRDLERAERDIYRADQPIDRARFLSVFPMRAQGGRGGDQAFENAIRRAADVVRDHPNSRWVDDALLLIGKAYFYQGNYDAAAQKFREVLLLEESRTREEARLWLGRSLMEARNFGDAAAELRQALAQNDLRPSWAAKMRLVLGEVELKRGDIEEAGRELRTGLDELSDPEIGARAAFLLGQVLETSGDFEGAVEAFQLSLDLRPTPELIYAAGLQRALALSRIDRADEALERLDRMRRDDRYYQQRAEVELVRARVLVAAGDPEAARDLIIQVLYYPDADMRIDRVRGHLHYRLAEIYRDGIDDFPRAAAHFDTAATAMRQSVEQLREVQTTHEAVLDVQRQAEYYGNFAAVHSRVAEMDSLLHLGSLDDETFTRTIEEIAEQRHQEALEAERERRRLADQQDFGGAPMAGGIPGTTPNGAGQGPATDAGFLSYRNPARVQENLLAFQTRWGDRPLVPNWRRRDAVSSAATAYRGRGNGEDGPITPTTAEGAYTALVDISAIPRDPESFEVMRRDRAIARYELGNVLFLTLGDTERAEYWYQKVIEEDADLPIVTRARYALAELYLETERRERAEDLLTYISELPDHDPLARAARERLGWATEAAPLDSLQLADASYATAFETWQNGDHADALRAMLDVDRRFTETPAAARARLAAGMIYIEWASADTLLLIAQSPDALLGDDERLNPFAFGDDGLFQVFSDTTASESPAATESHLDVEPGDEPPVDESQFMDEPVSPDPSPPGHDEGGFDIFAQAGIPSQQPGAAVPDSLEAGDGTEGLDASAGSEGDPDEPPTPVTSWLEELFSSIEADFPGTRFAERATRLRLVVEEQRLALEERVQELEQQRLTAQQLLATLGESFLRISPDYPPDPHREPEEFPEADPDATQPPDELPPPEIPDDEPPAMPLAEHIVELPPDVEPGIFDEAQLHGAEPIDPGEGGFSWVVLVTPRSFEAQNRLVSFHNAGYRTALVLSVDGSADTYMVIIGQFETLAEAAAAREALPDARNPDHVLLIELTSDIETQTAEDLLSR